MGGLDGEVPYLDEELFGSGSEDYVMTLRGSPSKLRPFCNPDLSLPSCPEHEPLGTEDNSDRCADRGSPANLTVFETPSISMEDRSGTLDDGQISTQRLCPTFFSPRLAQLTIRYFTTASRVRGCRGINGSPTMK
jgi:hypothetical protein